MKESEKLLKKEIDHVLEIEQVKKEADQLMMNKMIKHDEEINKLNNKINELHNNLDRTKKENNDLYNRVADLTESLKSKDYFHDHDYQYLIDENRKLEQERNELLTDNKRLAAQVEDKINQLRKSGM
jgi:uncharacterized phage infection (PIP) family protein YhgE